MIYNKKIVKKIAETHKQFWFTNMQLLRFQSPEKILILELILLDNVNNQPHYELQIENEQL